MNLLEGKQLHLSFSLEKTKQSKGGERVTEQACRKAVEFAVEWGHECVLGALLLSQEGAGAVLHLIFMVVPSVTPGHQKTAQKGTRDSIKHIFSKEHPLALWTACLLLFSLLLPCLWWE